MFDFSFKVIRTDTVLPMNTFIHTGSDIWSVKFSMGTYIIQNFTVRV